MSWRFLFEDENEFDMDQDEIGTVASDCPCNKIKDKTKREKCIKDRRKVGARNRGRRRNFGRNGGRGRRFGRITGE